MVQPQNVQTVVYHSSPFPGYVSLFLSVQQPIVSQLVLSFRCDPQHHEAFERLRRRWRAWTASAKGWSEEGPSPMSVLGALSISAAGRGPILPRCVDAIKRPSRTPSHSTLFGGSCFVASYLRPTVIETHMVAVVGNVATTGLALVLSTMAIYS